MKCANNFENIVSIRRATLAKNKTVMNKSSQNVNVERPNCLVSALHRCNPTATGKGQLKGSAAVCSCRHAADNGLCL